MGEDKQKILTDEERDAFRGTTIDEDGNAYDYGDRERDILRDKFEKHSSQGFHKFSVHSFGCGTGMLVVILFLCIIAGMFFFVLPFYLVWMLVAAGIYAVMKFFK